jgi:hypothetical protein
MLAECLGWALSRELGVRTPDCAVYSGSDGASFLSEVIADVLHWSDSRPQAMKDPGELGAVLALDALIANPDRNSGNFLFRPSPDDLELFSIDLANAMIGSPVLFAALGDAAPPPGTLVAGIPVALVRSGAERCAATAEGFDPSSLVEWVHEACHIAEADEVDTLVPTLKIRCASAGRIVRNYLELVEKRP